MFCAHWRKFREDTTHPYVWHTSITRGTWPIHIRKVRGLICVCGPLGTAHIKVVHVRVDLYAHTPVVWYAHTHESFFTHTYKSCEWNDSITVNWYRKVSTCGEDSFVFVTRLVRVPWIVCVTYFVHVITHTLHAMLQCHVAQLMKKTDIQYNTICLAWIGRVIYDSHFAFHAVQLMKDTFTVILEVSRKERYLCTYVYTYVLVCIKIYVYM